MFNIIYLFIWSICNSIKPFKIQTVKIKFVNLNDLNSYILIFGFIFLTQFAFIQYEVIDWDESTYFLISKYVSEGNVLYVDYWEAKPPMYFIFMGIVFKIFNSTILVGRLAGDFLIFISTLFVYKILSNQYSKIISLSSSFLMIYLFSYKSSQPTMTEHLGILFIVISFYLVINQKKDTNFYFLGILFSLAYNTRNNLAFACLAIFIFLFIKNYLNIQKVVYIGLGFLTPIISIAGYFIYHGKLANYIYMLWEFPLQSTDSYRMNFNEFKIAFLNKLNLDETISFELILFIVLITILIYLFKNINQLIESDISFLNILLLIFLAISIIFGGRLFNHYLIQLFPFIAILFGIGLSKISNKIFINIALGLSFVINLNLLIEGAQNLINYENISSNYPLKNIANELSNKGAVGRDVLALENHVIYMYYDEIVPFKVVHPSNLANVERYTDILNSLANLGLTSKDEFRIFVNNKPSYIFCENYCYSHITMNFFENNYELIYKIDNYKLFQKLSK